MQQRKRNPASNGQTMHLILIALFLFLTVSLFVKACSPDSSGSSGSGSGSITPPHAGSVELPSDQTGDSPKVTATASIGITGNVLVHDSVLQASLTENGKYDFTRVFSHISANYESYDFMVANLEVTFGGADAGAFTGENTFNTPDSLVDALKDAGIDMVLTSNEHTYDTGHEGFLRTQKILSQKGMLYTGTRTSTDTPNYIVQNINGIKIGMINYSFESGDYVEGSKTINDHPVDKADAELINTFHYRQMDKFYSEVEAAKAAMEADGADFVLVFIHWGNEYDLEPSNTQKKIAQNLCELGIDVIVGSHPHIVQPAALLTAENGHKTYCIYSTGNTITGLRRKNVASVSTGHTEDGVIYGLKFQRLSDGTVSICDMNATPLWTNLSASDSKYSYTIIPVDVTYSFYPALSEFSDTVNGVIDPDRPSEDMGTFTLSDPSQIAASYDRTMKTILTGLNECRQSLGLTPVSNTPGS